MDTSDNLDAIAAWLNSLVDSIDLTRAGREETLGHSLLGIFHEAISDRNRAEVDPDGGAWAENQGKYGERKQTDGVPVGVGHYSTGEGSPRVYAPGGEMLSLVEIQGEIDIQPDEAKSTYGTGDDVRRKGSWFTRGSDGPGEGEVSGAKNQPPRPFYGFNEADADAVLDEFGRFVDEILRG